MGQTIAQKIIAAHLVDGKMEPGCEVGLRIDQTLTQDATGTMAYLEYEAMGIPRVRTELSVAYIDHNTLQSGFMNADDHRFIRTIAKKIGVRYSRPGNGICHQVHLERFAKPGKTLIGSDSHTPTAGGGGMVAPWCPPASGGRHRQPCHGCGRSGRGRGHGRRRVLYPLSKSDAGKAFRRAAPHGERQGRHP